MSPTLPEPMLEGMPEPGALRLLTHEDEAVVLSGRWVVFRFPVADTGMRRLAMVALTEAGHPVKTVATVFGVHPNYLSTLRKTAREQGSNGLVRAVGRPPKLSAAQVGQARRWAEQGVSGQEIARRLDVSDTMISRLVGADRRRTTPVREELPDPDPEQPEWAFAGPVDVGPERVEPVDVGAPDRLAGAGSSRLAQATVDSRYAGAMMLHGFFDRVGARSVFACVAGSDTAARRCDDVALLTATTCAFALGVGSVEATKHLIRDQIGPLAGCDRLPELRTMRPRLAELAQACDPLRLQADLATAMIAADAPLLNLYFVDDHFVP